jgi:hypothetical protein
LNLQGSQPEVLRDPKAFGLWVSGLQGPGLNIWDFKVILSDCIDLGVPALRFDIFFLSNLGGASWLRISRIPGRNEGDYMVVFQFPLIWGPSAPEVGSGYLQGPGLQSQDSKDSKRAEWQLSHL